MDCSEITANPIRHPWELSRADIIIELIKDLCPAKRIIDIGCGDAYFIKRLKENLNNTEIFGIDTALKTDEISDDIKIFSSYSNIDGNFDTVLLMDILEHLKDEKPLLDFVKNHLARSGKILITVPAYQSLFSEHDTALQHFRRYNKKQLENLLRNNGFKITRIHYFYFSLVILRLISKLLNLKPQKISTWKHAENSPLTQVIRSTLNADFKLSALLQKFKIPLKGLSILAIAEIPTTNS